MTMTATTKMTMTIGMAIMMRTLVTKTMTAVPVLLVAVRRIASLSKYEDDDGYEKATKQ